MCRLQRWHLLHGFADFDAPPTDIVWKSLTVLVPRKLLCFFLSELPIHCASRLVLHGFRFFALHGLTAHQLRERSRGIHARTASSWERSNCDPADEPIPHRCVLAGHGRTAAPLNLSTCVNSDPVGVMAVIFFCCLMGGCVAGCWLGGS